MFSMVHFGVHTRKCKRASVQVGAHLDTKTEWGYEAQMPKNATDNDLLARIDALLEERGWNRARLARESGVAQSTIGRWADNEPKSDSLRAVAEALGCTIDELAGRATPRGDTHLASVARDFGLSASALNERAVSALRTFLREISPTQVTSSRQPSYAAPSTGGKMPDVVDSAVWNALTTEQQAGLALLLGGRQVEQWRIVAALELLFASPGPSGGGERVTGLVRAR
jgi:transcriptional regulator with XRE-family HTH domain